MFSIRKGSETKFRKYLTDIQFLKNKEGGFTNGNIEKSRQISYILTDLFEGKMSNSYLTDHIYGIILKTKIVDEIEFVNELNTRINPQGEKNQFIIVSTINLKYNTITNKSINLNKINFSFIDFSQAEKDYKISEHFNGWHLYRPEQKRTVLDYSYLVFEISEVNIVSAIKTAEDNLEHLRGIINLSQYYGSIHHHYYGGIPVPKTESIFQPPKIIMLYDANKIFLKDYFNIGFFDYNINELKKDRNAFLNNTIDEINSIPECPLKRRLFRALRKYNSGLDGNVSGTSFLEYWKIFELIALSDEEERGMPENKVAKRMASLIKDDQEFHQDTFNALCDKRNYIAHEGSLPEFDQEELNIIRKYCEGVISFLIWGAKNLEDESTLNFYYENISKPNKDLERMETSIKHIKESRNK